MTRFLTATFLAATLVLGWAPAISADDHSSRAPITGVHAFGDSLTDTGNLFELSGHAYPDFPYYEGRFSNGPVWVETLVLLLDVELNDLAVGGAFTNTGNSNESFIPGLANTGILDQIADFEAGGEIDSDDLVVIWGGANNYLFDSLTTPETVVADLEEAVERLADLGGRRFLVPNLPNLGDTPLGVSLGVGAQAFLNDQTQGHNARLAETMAVLGEELEVEILVLDINSLFKGVSVPGTAFANVTYPCLTPTGPTGACPFDGSTFDATANGGTLFWDPIHPTAAAHKLIAIFAQGALAGRIDPLTDDD